MNNNHPVETLHATSPTSPPSVETLHATSLNITAEMLSDWKTIMTCLYNYILDAFPDITSQAANCIKVGNLQIHCDFVNKKYIDLEITEIATEQTLLTFRYRGQLFPLFECVKQVVFFEIRELKKQPEWYNFINHS